MSTAQRIVLRVVSALVALALVAGAGLLIVEIVVQMTGGENLLAPTAAWYDSLRDTVWGSTTPVYAGIALVVAGLLLLAAAALARPRLFTLARPQHGVEVVIPPRAVAHMLCRQAETVAGVATASAEVDRDLARISVTAPLIAPQKVEQDLALVLTHGLKKIPWTRVPRLEIEVIGGRERTGSPAAEDLADGVR